MLINRDDVLKLRDQQRPKAKDYFIPLGGYDTKTQARKEISNLTMTLYNHLPLVQAMVDAAKDFPVYVGYDGKSPDTRNGTYTTNLILLHDAADESSLSFIQAYSHELVHLDQDRRGLLREHDPVPPPAQMVNYIAHNLMLEAAAFATEAVSLYYLSERSSLNEVDDEIEGYFDEYAATLPANMFLRDIIEEALEGKRGKDFQSLRPAWQAAFQAFFAPDSAHIANYLKQFTQVYLQKALNDEIDFGNEREWGGVNALRNITTLPGWGAMFPQGAQPVLVRQILASIVQEKYLPLIDVVRTQVGAKAVLADKALTMLLNLKP